MCAELSKNKKISASDVFNGFNHFFKSWGLMIVLAVIISLGFVALFIPGLLLLVMLQYAFPVSIIENKGIIDSLKKSWSIAKKHFVFSIVLLILLSLIQGIGSRVYVGVLVALPFCALCYCVAVEKVKGK